jgi:hypothetical protein
MNPMRKTSLLLALLIPLFVSAQTSGNDARYSGNDRKSAKTSIAHAKTEVYKTLSALLKTLPPDDFMRNHRPAISRDAGSKRTEEETRNVSLDTAYLFVLYRENDNDFHLIVGGKPDPTQAALMNMEISGLPDPHSPDYQVLKKVREAVGEKLGNIGKSKKLFIQNPLKISVSGSLFYDIDHKPGGAGYKNLKPKTAWEIHPVTEIIFRNTE